MSEHLTAVQTWMQQSLIDGTGSTDAALHVDPSETLQPAERLAIYQRGYYSRLIQCLEGQYKALNHALGNELFRDFAREYLLQFPSGSPTLAVLGHHFPDFLEASRPDKESDEKEPWIDFMVQLARYEWDLYTVFDAPGHEGKPLATVETSDSALRLQPCFFLHAYDFPVNRYYTGVALNQDPEIPEQETVRLAIVRTDFVTRVFSLLEPQYVFLEQMQEGCPAIAALEYTRAVFGSTEEQALTAWAEWRRNWTANGFFVG
jgi:hypothetical protein